MTTTSCRGSFGPLIPLLLTLGVAVAGVTPSAALVQDGPLKCAVAATTAAPPATVATPVSGLATPAADFPDDGGELIVFAAASLTDAFERIADGLETANEGLSITYNFAGSQALVTQLQEGAEADVFASANVAQMEAAVEDGSIAGDPVTFVRNRLAIVVPVDNPAGIETPADLGQEGLRLVLAQADVPVGRYAREAVCKMGEDPAAYGEGFVESVAVNVASEEEDVRDVLARVQLGEADAGIVYVSDASAAADEVELIEIPDDVNVVATYPIAAVEGGDAALGEAFIAYVLGSDGQAILEDFGFELVIG